MAMKARAASCVRAPNAAKGVEPTKPQRPGATKQQRATGKNQKNSSDAASLLAHSLLIMPSHRILPRIEQVQLLQRLAEEAGWRHLVLLSLLSLLGTLLEIAGLGLAVGLLLSSTAGVSKPLAISLPLPTIFALLVLLVLLRGQLRAQVAISMERLRSGFTDRLRQQLLTQVFAASSAQLEHLGRGELLGLLMADINRTVLSLEQAIRLIQACFALVVYLLGVLLVGRTSAWPLLLALTATAAASLLQRSGSWELGRNQSRLNASLQRTVGDGLHGLKAIRAAAAEPWLLNRFALETAESRELLQEQLRRRSGYNSWRDTLVVAAVGLWMLSRGEALSAEIQLATLLLAYRAGSYLSSVVQAQRLCLWSLPGYEALCLRRQQLQPPQPLTVGQSIPKIALVELTQKPWSAMQWRDDSQVDTDGGALKLQAGRLVVITGPSGSGKTTLLDRICGLLAEEHSQWEVRCDQQSWCLSGAAGAHQLHQLIAYAPQNAVLLESSLRDNLLLGREHPEVAIKNWLRRLGLNDLLLREEGLDTPMHLAQDPFSGGEIQRLCLLRAWLRQLPVEVLDEPTAFLDATAAEQVRNVIQERVRERLVLVSTHDSELVRQADQVIQLKPLSGSEAYPSVRRPPAKAIDIYPSPNQSNRPV